VEISLAGLEPAPGFKISLLEDLIEDRTRVDIAITLRWRGHVLRKGLPAHATHVSTTVSFVLHLQEVQELTEDHTR
jgi:hypothetical protein